MATLAQVGIPAAGFGHLQPRQKHKFQATFIGLAALVPGANGRELTRQVVSFSRPKLSFEAKEQHRYNSTSYYAGKHSWDELNLTIEDDITGLASYAIQGQFETQQRLLGGDLPGQWLNSAATASEYKFGIILEQLDGNEGVTETWKIEGCFITNADYGENTYDSADALTISLRIRFDHARQDLTGAGYGTAIGGNLG